VTAAARQRAERRAGPRPRAPVLQRRCACGGVPGPGGECAECMRKRLARNARGSAAPELAPPIVHEVLRSPGRPLEPVVRAQMERRLGHDFSRVRVHTDARAADSAHAVRAEAYTVGADVVFGAGRYSPASGDGMRLLAHELAHVVQQAPAGPASASLRVAAGGGVDEAEAAAAAQGARVARPGSPSAGLVQRQEQSPKPQKPPLIPIPVFDELDPMVIVPDLPGVPSFLRGQSVKLSNLRTALDAARGDLPSLGGGGGEDICGRLLPGHEQVRSGPMAGLCCPKFRRERCCRYQDIGQLDYRCCRADEVVIQGHCVRPRLAPPTAPPAPTPTPTPTPSAPTPTFPTLPPLELPGTRIRFGTIQSATIDHFAFDSAALPAGVSETLDRLAGQIKLYRDATVHVDGHTDSTQTEAYNRPLSDSRAKTVRDELVRRGVDPSRLIVHGYGEERPLFPAERSEDEKARNRRVDVWLHIPPSERPLGGSLRPPSFPRAGAGEG
jgi:outer membrane protein OmpA-like peptidoglycan-associated protein